MLTKQHGNMYSFVTHTWNPIKGKCIHDCSYCYMKVFPQKGIRLDVGEMGTHLGTGNYIFVGSGTDMFAKDVPDSWIDQVLEKCRMELNTYLFQSKNPQRFHDWITEFPHHTILATTIETNRDTPQSVAPSPYLRQSALVELAMQKTVTIEPIMDFDLPALVKMVKDIHPDFVSIGADSKNHHLPEPSSEKIKALIEELQCFTIVKQKDNLRRLFTG